MSAWYAATMRANATVSPAAASLTIDVAVAACRAITSMPSRCRGASRCWWRARCSSGRSLGAGAPAGQCRRSTVDAGGTAGHTSYVTEYDPRAERAEPHFPTVREALEPYLAA